MKIGSLTRIKNYLHKKSQHNRQINKFTLVTEEQWQMFIKQIYHIYYDEEDDKKETKFLINNNDTE